jgi:hypothetical protein
MKDQIEKIIEFTKANELQPDSLLTLTLRFASLELARELEKRTKKKLKNITDEDVFRDYLVNIKK